MALDEYDPAAKQITGNCLFYNRVEARVAPKAMSVTYIAFDVPAGDYVYSPFSAWLSRGQRGSRMTLLFREKNTPASTSLPIA